MLQLAVVTTSPSLPYRHNTEFFEAYRTNYSADAKWMPRDAHCHFQKQRQSFNTRHCYYILEYERYRAYVVLSCVCLFRVITEHHVDQVFRIALLKKFGQPTPCMRRPTRRHSTSQHKCVATHNAPGRAPNTESSLPSESFP